MFSVLNSESSPTELKAKVLISSGTKFLLSFGNFVVCEVSLMKFLSAYGFSCQFCGLRMHSILFQPSDRILSEVLWSAARMVKS